MKMQPCMLHRFSLTEEVVFYLCDEKQYYSLDDNFVSLRIAGGCIYLFEERCKVHADRTCNTKAVL